MVKRIVCGISRVFDEGGYVKFYGWGMGVKDKVIFCGRNASDHLIWSVWQILTVEVLKCLPTFE